MKNFTFLSLFLCLSLFFTSCKKTEENIDSEDLSFQLIENHKEIKGKVSFNGGNENCGKIYVSAQIEASEGKYAEITFTLLSNGELVSVKYNTNTPTGHGVFYSQTIEPKKSFSIEDFKYDPQNQTVSFKFKGKVFEFPNAKSEREIEGSIQAKEIGSVGCEALIFDIRTTDPKFQFFSTISSSGKSLSNVTNEYYDYRYNTFSNSGQHLVLKLENGISSYLGQEIDLDEVNQKNWVEYMEYIGPFTANYNYSINPEEWKKFKVKGKIQSLKKHSNPPESFGTYYEGFMVLDIYDKEKLIVENAVLPFEVSK